MNVRPAAVAGLFYPADANALRHTVTTYLRDRQQGEAPDSADAAPHALIVPHAGYIYSGSLAAIAYRRVAAAAEKFDRVLVLGPAHRMFVHGMAVPGTQAFATPLGEVPLDTETIETLLTRADVDQSDRAHADEHCLEVQVPFLQCLLGEIRLVPVLVGDCPPEQVSDLIASLWEPRTLVIVSTDLSHFHDDATARRLDAVTLERILRCQPVTDDQACGCRPLNGLLQFARGRSLSLELIGNCTSADTSGDLSRVVGYGAFAVHDNG